MRSLGSLLVVASVLSLGGITGCSKGSGKSGQDAEACAFLRELVAGGDVYDSDAKKQALESHRKAEQWATSDAAKDFNSLLTTMEIPELPKELAAAKEDDLKLAKAWLKILRDKGKAKGVDIDATAKTVGVHPLWLLKANPYGKPTGTTIWGHSLPDACERP